MIIYGPTELGATKEPLQWGIHVDVSKKPKGKFPPSSFILSIDPTEREESAEERGIYLKNHRS
jgi:hypothetical protein